MATINSPKVGDKRSILTKMNKFGGSVDCASPGIVKGSPSGTFQRFHSQEQSEVSSSRTFSRSQSITTDRGTRLRSGSREYLLEEPLVEEPITEEITFEEKKCTSAASKKIISSDGKSTEHTMATNKESKRVQKGDNSYEQSLCANVARERVAENGISCEKTAATRQEEEQLKIGENIQQHKTNTQAASVKVKSNDLTSEKTAMSKAEESRFISQNVVQQQKRNLTTSQNYSMTSKGVTASGGSVQKQTFYNDASSPSFSTPLNSTVYMAITQGVDDDIKFLSSSSVDVTNEMSGAKERFTNRLSTCVENLQSAATLEEANLLMNGMADMMRKAWTVPKMGDDLAASLCGVFREKGGLDLVLQHLGSGSPPELQLASARLLEQFLESSPLLVGMEELSDVVAAATGCSQARSVSHARAGTALLEQVCKHSEQACSSLIRLGGLDAIMMDCRREDTETLRHCAKTLANLALFGGTENQRSMVRHDALLWLFYLGSHSDPVIRYFACLANAALVANKEIEMKVLKSDNLSLVEKFVLHEDPQDYAAMPFLQEGQSKSWLERLVPVLASDRMEAQSMAAFHFAVEAQIRKGGDTKVFKEIRALEALRKVASSPNAVASRLAGQVLETLGAPVPRKLSAQVPLWTEDDVVAWVEQIGFGDFGPAFRSSRVDGDLLFNLDETMLREDIGITNRLLRKRFLRDLNQLKKRCDYTACGEGARLAQILQGLGPEFTQYTYSLLQAGLLPGTLHQVTDEQLAQECGITNSIHRDRILHALRGLELTEEAAAGDDKKVDVFISYRRSNGAQLASLLKVHLQLRGFTTFLDVERLEAGKFDYKLLDSIKHARHFLLVLTPNALDRCQGDAQCKDWVHKEISEALKSHCNIIPIIDNFQWPEPETLPDDIRPVCYFNGIRWVHDYQEACIDKLERFLKGGDVKTLGTPSTPSKSLLLQRRTPSVEQLLSDHEETTASESRQQGSHC